MPFENDLDLAQTRKVMFMYNFLPRKMEFTTHNISLDTEQIFRYGSTSRNYTETTLNLTQKMQDNTLFSNTFNVNKSGKRRLQLGELDFPTI